MYFSSPGASSAGDGVRYAVVTRLQDQLTRKKPGSRAYEILDRAISLTLSSRRAVVSAAYLERNVRRDARRILARARGRTVVDPFTPDTVIGRAVEQGLHPALVENVSTPEALAVASSLRRAIEARVVARLGLRGLRCLTGLIDAETPQETADALGVSSRTVDRLRLSVRDIASALVAQEA
ncbi:MAG TPA: hypothetical protein VF746_03140 [Longimicrobium sp.]|jgi:hypothetical protein